MKRRDILSASLASVVAAMARASGGRAPRIVLRSSWQVVNIGDIAHTPGVLALIEQHIPDAEVVLWASADLTPEVAAMLRRRFPRLRIVKGAIDASGRATTADLSETIDWADFLLHGSGPSLVAAKDVAAFARHTGKPFGVYGITHGSFLAGSDRQLLEQARFVYFRDSVSLERARQERYTPYWLVRPGARLDESRHARNEAMKESDHQELRQAIIAVIRETPLKVLLCPEDMTQMAVGKEMFFDRLPADVKARVVWRPTFWLTDEALGTYVRSAGLFGSEMHSPIMAVGHGIPAIVCRFEEQTSKGIMWRDIGLGEWLFDLDRPEERKGIVPAVLALAHDPAAARAKAAKARAYVQQRQRETMAVVKSQLPGL
jgi:polysaccharide pyruvyl transferase WcaK-like protein